MTRQVQRIKWVIPLVSLLLVVGVLSGCGGGVRATNWTGLAVDDGIVYVADLQQVVALDAESGDVIWNTGGEPDLGSLGPFYTVTLLPDEALFVASQERSGRGLFSHPQGVLRGLSIEGDDVLWEFRGTTGDYIAGGAVSDGILVIGNSDANVYAFQVEDGSPAWSEPYVTEGRVWSTPLIVSDTVYVSSLGHALYALDLATGRPEWDQPFEVEGAIPSRPLGLGGRLFVGSFDHNLYAVWREDGTAAWSEPFEGQNWFWGTPATDGTYVYAADVNGNVYAVNAETGEEEWSEALEDLVAQGLQLNGDADVLLVAANSGTLYALDPRDGSRLWSEAGEGQPASLVVDGDVVYVSRLFTEARVQAFRIDGDGADLLWVYPQPEAEE